MRTYLRILTILLIGLGLAQTAEDSKKKLADGKPLQVLLITGGCCHNYLFQSLALTTGVEKSVNAEFTVVNEGGTGTRGKIDLYNNPDWAKPYDVVIHNECFAETDAPEYIKKITAAHKAGKPSVVIHCAMHTYRAAKFDDWREFLGVTSRHHEHQSNYPVKIVKEDHPIMKGFKKDWVTAKDELYIIKKLWPKATSLAVSKSEKTGEEQPVVWVNDYHGTRVFGTTYGHSDDTFRDETFVDLVTRGLLWAAGKDGSEAQPESVKPGINKNFLDPNLIVKDWLGKFEVESREVYDYQKEIIAALKIAPGTAIADIGAGTGLYMEPFSKATGDAGKVFSVDIAPAFIKHLTDRKEKAELANVEVVLCAEDSVKLPESSVDLAFVCDTYHHFEYPAASLASMLAAVKPGGRLALIDFKRIPGVSRDWLLEHVRAGKDVFCHEIESVGFKKVEEVEIEGLKENYFVIFQKPE